MQSFVSEFLRTTAAKLDSRNFYDAPLDQYTAAIVHRAEFLALADELDGRNENIEEYGTRARGTESFVYRILQSPSYRTEEIIARFLDAAITPTQPQGTLRKRARKLLALIGKHGDSAIPRTTLELVSWSELTAEEHARPIESMTVGQHQLRKARRRTRHFKPCKQCKTRFLAKRADQDFCKPKCRVRWNRVHRDVTDNCSDGPQAIENAGDNRAVFALPPVLVSEAHSEATCP